MSQKILLIEDNPILSELYKKALEAKKFDVFIAHDGETGIQVAKKEIPSLITLDLLMVGIDGFEVLKRLKEDKNTQNIPVVILSIIDNQESKEKAKALGASDYLIKSELQVAEIVNLISAHL